MSESLICNVLTHGSIHTVDLFLFDVSDVNTELPRTAFYRFSN